MLSARKATYTVKVLVSWALLPLLTNHSLCYLRFRSLVTRSRDGRLTKVVVASSNHASTLIGSPLTHRCSLLSSLDFMKEFFMMCSYTRAVDNAPTSRIMVSLLLPHPMEADQWLHKVRANRHMWPLQMTSHSAANQLTTEIFMRRERRRLQARHIWKLIQPNWPMIKERVWTKHATGLPYRVLHRRLFLHEFGLKIPTRGQMNTGSSGNGNVVKHGLLRKLLLSFRANGSALCTFKGLINWMCCLGNGLTTVSESWYKYGTPSRESSDVNYHRT